MTQTIAGLHHVTSICSSPQKNLDFYTKTLRQRLVKRTVNFDDPGTYHLYYGDCVGSPGTILTFFPFAHAAPGRAGPGAASAVAYTVPQGALVSWMETLAEEGTDFEGPFERFGEQAIALHDPDGMRIELIEQAGEDAADTNGHGATGPSIGGFHSTTLWSHDPAPTVRLLTDVLGLSVADHAKSAEGERIRLVSPGYASIDVIRTDKEPNERQGVGSFHHVAFRAKTNEEHLAWREAVLSSGLQVTPVIDRQYFNAIYFREPGGVLFEIATDPPGFARDESVEDLGKGLMLPQQYEAQRSRIEAMLPPLTV